MEEDSLLEAFWAVTRRLREHTRIALEPWHISPSQSRALGVLSRHGEMRLSSVAEHLRIAPRSATEVIDDLQRRGLAERKPDPSDRRATLVTLTPEGVATMHAIREARAAEGERLFTGLDPADRAELTRILRQLREARWPADDQPGEHHPGEHQPAEQQPDSETGREQADGRPV
ncbi:MarR family winged helix-turn-helix transcriptional regulator [Actinoplanes sandaracinus]|uniref:MarR family winged helix-turn-helix transcriptional regulator n=1 Tax=Actinoplanes sandaracinus TaxID=3045177 RepID=UPI002E244B79